MAAAAAAQAQASGATGDWIIHTAVGPGATGDGGPATAAWLKYPEGIAADAAGNVYIADSGNARIRKIDAATGVISTIAGTGMRGYSGDGGPAAAAQISQSYGAALDAAGNLYIADSENSRIRKVDAATGVISTIAGTGTFGYSGDGGPATAAQIWTARDAAVDAAGNVYIADGTRRVRKVDALTGVISTFAGTGASSGPSGDGGPAAAAVLRGVLDVAADAAGNVYIADRSDHRIRKVDASTGNISTFAGTGTAGFSGDGGPAAAAQIDTPWSVAADQSGNVYIADRGNHRIRKVNAAGAISTIAGTGAAGYSGDGGPAAAARLYNPRGVAPDAEGNVYIADRSNHRIRKIDAATGVISTIAGTGAIGDGGPATAAQLYYPRGTALDAAGNLYVSDAWHAIIRKIDAATGVISTVAGTAGAEGFSGDGGPAAAARLLGPSGIALDADGNLYIADTINHRIRKVDAAGTISTVAGTGAAGYSGDNGPATAAQLNLPWNVAADAEGNLYIADQRNNRIRKVDAATGIISTFAGTGALSGPSGDGGPASAARISQPWSVALDADGNLYISDVGNFRIRKVDAETGAISTVAGTGTKGFSGDGGPATAAQIDVPYGVALDGGGNLYIADVNNKRIRKVDTAGIMTTIAGTGTRGSAGDGGPASAAQLGWPNDLAADAEGNLYISDGYDDRIRKICPPGRVCVIEPPASEPIPEPMLPAVHARPLTLRFTLPQDAAPGAQAAVLYIQDGETDSLLEPALDWSVQSSARWLTAAPRHGSLPPGREQTLTVSADPAGMRAGSHQARLFVRTQERITVRIRVSLDVLPPLGPAVSEHGVVNAAARSAFGRPGLFGPQLLPLAPGSLVAVEGLNFLPAGAAPLKAEALPLPTALADVRVLFDGIAAPLFRVEAESIAAQLPAALGAAALEAGRIPLIETVVEAGGRRSWPRRFPLAPQAPGVFTASGQGRGQALALLLDGGGLAAPRGYAAGSRPARAGDLVEICATGLGAVEPPLADGMNSCPPDGRCPTDGSTIAIRHTRVRPQVWIGGYRLGGQDVLFSFLEPNFVGVNSVIVRIPRNIPANEAAEVVIEAGGRRSQPGVTMAVE